MVHCTSSSWREMTTRSASPLTFSLCAAAGAQAAVAPHANPLCGAKLLAAGPQCPARRKSIHGLPRPCTYPKDFVPERYGHHTMQRTKAGERGLPRLPTPVCQIQSLVTTLELKVMWFGRFLVLVSDDCHRYDAACDTASNTISEMMTHQIQNTTRYDLLVFREVEHCAHMSYMLVPKTSRLSQMLHPSKHG